MNLSRDWSAGRLFQVAMTGLDETAAAKNMEAKIKAQRFDYINRAVQSVASTFYDIVGNSYMTPATIIPDTAGNYYVSGASWAFETLRLTATMNTVFATTDVGKLIAFRIGTSVYVGLISGFVSTTVVEVSGDNLPTADGTVSYVLVADTVITSDRISLISLRIMMAYADKLELESSTTGQTRAVSVNLLPKIALSGAQNTNLIFWAFNGDEILLKKGSSISTYGTLTLRYPRVPALSVIDTGLIDLPDGALTDLAVLKLRSILASIIGVAVDSQREGEALVRTFLRSTTGEAQEEVVKEKLLALR